MSDLVRQRWYAHEDDAIGGWAILNIDCPPSQMDPETHPGVREVGCFLDENVARHIVALHNATLGNPLQVTGQYGSPDSPARDADEPGTSVIRARKPVTGSDIGGICRCLSCCCPPGQGHNHPRFAEYLATVLDEDEQP